MAVKEVHGPGPRGARGPRPKVENPGMLLKRIMDVVFWFCNFGSKIGLSKK